MSPGRQTKPLDCARPDWMESRLGATSRMKPASSVDKANKREEADLSSIGRLLLPPNMPLDEGHAYLARWSGGVSIRARVTGALQCGWARLYQRPQEGSEVRFDTPGACFHFRPHMGSRVRRDSAQSPTA